jgi:hypothetical protein
MLFEGHDEMFDVGSVNIFNSKIIDDEGEVEISGGMLPKAWGDGAWGIAMGLEESD